MPVTNILLDEVQTNIADNVIKQSVISILTDLDVYHKLQNRNISIISDHQKDGSSRDKDSNIRLENTDRCHVDATFISNPQKVRWDVIHFGTLQTYGQAGSPHDRAMKFPLFSDNEIGLRVIEQMAPKVAELDFTLTFNDKNDALKVETILVNKYQGTALLNIHDLVYTYPLSIDFLSVLKCFYNLKKSYNASKDFIQYLKDYFTKEFTWEHLKGDSDKKRPCLKSYQLNALGLLEYDQDKPEAVNVGGSTDRWEIKFRYSLQFGCPDSFILDYPSVVENSLVPTLVTPPATESTFSLRELEGIIQTKPFNHMMRERFGGQNLLIRIPSYETFNPPHGPLQDYKYRPFLISALLLEDEGVSTFDLKDIGGITPHPVTIAMMKKAGRDIFRYNNLFNVTVYARDAVMRDGVSIDEDLILTIDDVSRSVPYYLVLSEATKLDNLNVDSIVELTKHRWFFGSIIAQNLQILIENGWFKLVPSKALLKLIGKLIYDRSLETYASLLYSEGHATNDIFFMTLNAYQFCEYISTKPSMKDPDRRFLYDVLMDKLAEDGRVFAPYPPMNVRTTRSNTPIEYDFMETGYALSVPFRVAHYQLDTSK